MILICVIVWITVLHVLYLKLAFRSSSPLNSETDKTSEPLQNVPLMYLPTRFSISQIMWHYLGVTDSRIEIDGDVLNVLQYFYSFIDFRSSIAAKF